MSERKRLQWQVGKRTNCQGRKILRSEVLNKRKSVENNNRFVFNITYHPVLSKLKNVLSEIRLLLTLDREHGKVFERIPIVGFRRAKSLKDIRVRAKVAPLDKKKGSCRSYGCTRCEICKHVISTETFRSFSTQREYCIKANNLNCRFNNVVYLFSCKTCSKQYTGSTESFRSIFKNYKSAHKNFRQYRQRSIISLSLWGCQTSWYEWLGN